jgi:hypothetical protein
MKTQKLLAAAALLATAGSALAVTELQIDINALRAQSYNSNATKGFSGVNHSGYIILSSGSATNLAEILINGNAQGIAANMLMSVSGRIDLDNGFVTGGDLTVTLMNNAGVFTADIPDTSGDVTPGRVRLQAGQGFSIDGLVMNGMFDMDTFAGVDVSLWHANEPLSGSFIEFAFGPNGLGFDGDTNLDVFLPVEDRPGIPAPLAGFMGGFGLLGLGARRRR